MISKEAAQKVAQWWAGHLRRGTEFSCLTPKERRNPRERGAVLAEVFANATNQPTSPDKAAAFEAALVKLILEARDGGSSHYILSVDYNPDLRLGEALKQAGIPRRPSPLPWKSHTRVCVGDGRAYAKQGYGAQEVEL